MTAALAALAFVKNHWRGCAGVLALAAAFGAGYRTHARLNPPTVCAPAVAKVEDDHQAKDVDAKKDTLKQEGPKRIVKLNFDPAPNRPDEKDAPADLCRPVVVPGLGEVQAPPGERLESVTIEDDGASSSETKAATETHATEDRHLDLKITPAAIAPADQRYALQAGLEDVLHARTLRLAGRLRVVGPLWAELAVTPASRGVGVAASVQW
jgi:hypothetical protein